MSIANTVANIPVRNVMLYLVVENFQGFAQSAVAGAILDSDNTSEAKWGYIFLVQAVVMTFGGVFFIAFGSGTCHMKKSYKKLRYKCGFLYI